MAVLRFEVSEIIKEWDGEICEIEAVVVSVHKDMFPSVLSFFARKEMKVGEEFQLNKYINQI